MCIAMATARSTAVFAHGLPGDYYRMITLRDRSYGVIVVIATILAHGALIAGIGLALGGIDQASEPGDRHQRRLVHSGHRGLADGGVDHGQKRSPSQPRPGFPEPRRGLRRFRPITWPNRTYGTMAGVLSCGTFWAVEVTFVAMGILWLTVRTFDGCFDRIPDSRHRISVPARRGHDPGRDDSRGVSSGQSYSWVRTHRVRRDGHVMGPCQDGRLVRRGKCWRRRPSLMIAAVLVITILVHGGAAIGVGLALTTVHGWPRRALAAAGGVALAVAVVLPICLIVLYSGHALDTGMWSFVVASYSLLVILVTRTSFSIGDILVHDVWDVVVGFFLAVGLTWWTRRGDHDARSAAKSLGSTFRSANHRTGKCVASESERSGRTPIASACQYPDCQCRGADRERGRHREDPRPRMVGRRQEG